MFGRPYTNSVVTTAEEPPIEDAIKAFIEARDSMFEEPAVQVVTSTDLTYVIVETGPRRGVYFETEDDCRAMGDRMLKQKRERHERWVEEDPLRRLYARPPAQPPLALLAYLFDLKVMVADEETWWVLTGGNLDVLRAWTKGGEEWRQVGFRNLCLGKPWMGEDA